MMTLRQEEQLLQSSMCAWSLWVQECVCGG